MAKDEKDFNAFLDEQRKSLNKAFIANHREILIDAFLANTGDGPQMSMETASKIVDTVILVNK